MNKLLVTGSSGLIGSDVVDYFSKPSRMQLAVFLSHPIQHFSPLFQELSSLVDLHVFYYSDFALKEEHVDKEFGVAFKWDIPLLEGYSHSFLPTVPWQNRSYLGPYRMNLGIRRILREHKWDGILLFGYSSINEWQVWVWAAMTRVPVLYISDSELLHRRFWFRRILKEIPLRVFFSRLAGFLAVGDQNREYARRYGVRENHIYNGRLPIDLVRFRQVKELPDLDARLSALRRRYDIPQGSSVALFCGKFAPHKRPLDLVRALNLVQSSRPVIGLFVGAGALENEIRSEGCDRVRITGFINQQEIPVYYALGDFLVVPSEMDAHPQVVTEAASLGIPAIVSDKVGCIGPNDLLRPDESGLVYMCGHPEQLAKLIERLILYPALRAGLGERAKSLAETQSPGVAARLIRDALFSVAHASSA